MNFSLSRNWWLVMLRGVIAIAFGVLAFASPLGAWLAFSLLFGVYALVDGLFALTASVTGRHRAEEPWWALLVEGLVGVGVGLVTFAAPQITELALAYLIAFWAIVTGVLEIGSAVRLRRHIANEWLLALSGILSLVFGVLMVGAPAAGVVAVVYLIAAYAVIFGVLMLVLGFQLLAWGRRMPSGPVA